MHDPYALEEEDPLVIARRPTPTGQVIQQGQLQAAPNAAPAPPAAPEVQAFAQGAPAQPQQEVATAPPPVQPAAEGAPDPFARPVAEEPVIMHRRKVDDREEQAVQQRDQVRAERQQREDQRKADQDYANKIRGYKDAGVQMRLDPNTGESRPETDEQGRVLYKPAVVDPFHEDETGVYSVKRDIYGETHKIPLQPKLDPATGERFVIGEDGVTKKSLGVDQGFLEKRDMSEAGKVAGFAKGQLADLKKQQTDLKKRQKDLTDEIALNSSDKEPTVAQKISIERAKSDLARVRDQMAPLQQQYDELAPQAQALDQEYNLKRGAVVARAQADYAKRNPGSAIATQAMTHATIADPSVAAPEVPADAREKVPQGSSSDFLRGIDVSLKQLKPLAQGTIALLAGTAEKALGEGGHATAVKQWGLQGYKDGMEKANAIAHENDDVTVAWAKAKTGDIGALVDWAQYGAGYLIGQAGETAGVSALAGLIGGVAGSETGPGAAVTAAGGAVVGAVAKGAVKTGIKGMIEKLIAKSATKLVAEQAAEAGVKMTAEQIAEQAGTAAMKKLAASRIAQNTAMAANGLMQEAGSIYPEAVQKAQEEGRELTGTDLAKVWATSIAAGAVEGLTDRLGLDTALGHGALSRLGGRSRIAAGLRTGTALAAAEGGTEFAQTVLERLGAGQSITDEDAKKDYLNSTLMGALGGAGLGGGSAFVHHDAAGPGNRDFAKQWNEDHKDIPGFAPIAHSDAPMARSAVNAAVTEDLRNQAATHGDAMMKAAAALVDAEDSGDPEAIRVATEDRNAAMGAAKAFGDRLGQTRAAVVAAVSEASGAQGPEGLKARAALKAATGEKLSGQENTALLSMKDAAGAPIATREGQTVTLSPTAAETLRATHPAIASFLDLSQQQQPTNPTNGPVPNQPPEAQTNGKAQEKGAPKNVANGAGSTPASTPAGGQVGGATSATGTAPTQGATPVRKAVGFKTAKGSTYTIHEDGSTTRNKAARPEHPGDQGPQPRSKATFYITPEQSQLLGEVQAKGPNRPTLRRTPSGEWGVYYVDGPSKGKFEARTLVRPSDEPAVGLLPVEMWEGSNQPHFGNPITEVSDAPAAAKATTATPATAPKSAALPPQLAGAKPRYSLGTKQFDLNFASDLDKAAYITAQTSRSKHDAAFLKHVMDATGMSEEEVREHGKKVRAAIKAIATAQESGTIDLPDQGPKAAKKATTEPTAPKTEPAKPAAETPKPKEEAKPATAPAPAPIETTPPPKPEAKPDTARAQRFITKAMGDGRVKRTLDAIGAKVGTWGGDASFLAGFHEEKGALRFGLSINPERIAEKTAAMTDAQAEEYITAAISEEVTHLAQFEAARRDWEKAKTATNLPPLTFKAFFELQYQAVAKAMSEEEVAAVKEAYGRELETAEVGAEFVRQLIQQGTEGRITEATHAAKPLLERILAILKELIANPAARSEALQRAHDATMRVLEQIDEKPAESPTPETTAPITKKTGAKKKAAALPTKEKATEAATVKSKASDATKDKAREALDGLFASEPIDKVRTAYKAMVSRTGFPSVSIGALARESGIGLDRLHEQLRQAFQRGEVVFSAADWSLADNETRGGAMTIQGNRQLNVRFLNDGLRASEPLAQVPFPMVDGKPDKARRAKLLDLIDSLQEDGITTPAELAAFLDEISPKLRPYSQSLWDMMSAAGAVERGTHEWADVYASLAQPNIQGNSESNETPTPNGDNAPGDRGEDAPAAGGSGKVEAQPNGGNDNGNVGDGVSDDGKTPETAEPVGSAGGKKGGRRTRGGDGQADDGKAPVGGVSEGGEKGSGGVKSTNGTDVAPGEHDGGSTGTPVGHVDGDRPASLARSNYHLTNPELLVGGGPKARFKRNREALETYERITLEQREPTPDELDTMAAYMGWGSFGQELFKGSWDHPTTTKGWEDENEWLRQHLGEAGWKSANDSIINAHYTDPPTVDAIWRIAEQLGFKGGRVLEPSMGVGNFFALMPREMMARSELTGIEMDTVVGGIAKMLYPQANVQVKGYQDSLTADNFYDLVIGNWPFAKDGPSDRRYNSLKLSLHDYFFVKALDQVRPGGLVIGITSSGTMDKKGETARRQMAKRAELVASFRMPTGAFQKYAGTKVVTDLLILRKREEPLASASDELWVKNAEVAVKGGEKVTTNQYYVANPDNILGELAFGSGTTTGRPGMIVNRQDNYPEVLAALQERVPADVMQPWTPDKPKQRTIANTEKRRQNAAVYVSDRADPKENGFYVVKGEQMVLLDDVVSWRLADKKDTAKREADGRSVIGIADTLTTLLDEQRSGAATANETRAKLKAAYLAHVEQFGHFAKSPMVKVLQKAGDPRIASVRNLEVSTDGETWAPRDILERDIMRRREPGKATDIEDAYAMSRNDTMQLDLDAVAKLSGEPREKVIERLVALDQIFQAPDRVWYAREEYLGGNVRQKLREAIDAKQQGMEMERNIAALEQIQPKDVPYFAIEVQMGAAWVPKDDYMAFASHLLGIGEAEDATKKISVMKAFAGWDVRILDPKLSQSPNATERWGIQHVNMKFQRILQAAMNGTAVQVRETDEKGVVHVNEEATKKANGKVDAIREEFAAWLWRDPTRTGRLTRDYNEALNAIVNPSRNGSHLRFEGLSLKLGDTEFDFRQHQKDAVWRGIQDGRGMFFHEVGTGKTFTIAGLAMEGRRLGRFRKPILFAHNANHEDVARDVVTAYPSAKVLHIDSISPSNRENMLRQIALDDWDLIVMPHSLIDRFAMRGETLMEMAHEEIAQLEAEIYEAAREADADLTTVDLDDEKAVNKALARKKGAHTAKDLVRMRKRIIKRIMDKADSAVREGALIFEEMGIDAVMVDEAHMFKKINLATRKQLKGLNKEESGRGWMLNALTTYVKRQNSGKGVFLFTGTPLTNNLNEAFNMMQYVMDDVMTAAGVRSFDDWFNAFAAATTDVELTSGGTLEPVTRLLSFVNVPELARMAARYFDVVLAKHMPEFVERESAEGMSTKEKAIGRPHKKMHAVTSDMSPEQAAWKADIEQRYKTYQKLSPKEKREVGLKGGDTPVLMDMDGAKSALDHRLITLDPADDFKNSKINRMVDVALRHYAEHEKATQAIFLENGVNDWVENERVLRDAEGFAIKNDEGKSVKIKERRPAYNLVRDMVEKLVKGGVDPSEIAVFANMNLDPEEKRPDDVLRKVIRVNQSTKADTAALMREGKVRFAIGSTQTLGTGVNAQTYMRAMHHIDAPWTPGEFEQRNGRGWRQGNRWNTVHEYRYFTEASHDSRRWQVLLNKVRFIQRFTDMLLDSSTGKGIRVLAGDGADMNEGGDSVADFADSFSSAVGDPRVQLRAKLKADVEKLEGKRSTHFRAIEDARGRIASIGHTIETDKTSLGRWKDALEKYRQDRAGLAEGAIALTIGDKTFTQRAKAEDYLKAMPSLTKTGVVGRVGSFEIYYDARHSYVDYDNRFSLRAGDDIEMRLGKLSVASIDATLRQLPQTVAKIAERITSNEQGREGLKSMLSEPFGREEELTTKRASLAQIEAEMARSPKPAPAWLRNTVPIGSLVYLDDKKAYDVAAHRRDENGFWVLIDDNNSMRPVKYLDVYDEAGTRIFDVVDGVTMADTTEDDLPPTRSLPGWLMSTPKTVGGRESKLARIYRLLDKQRELMARDEGREPGFDQNTGELTPAVASDRKYEGGRQVIRYRNPLIEDLEKEAARIEQEKLAEAKSGTVRGLRASEPSGAQDVADAIIDKDTPIVASLKDAKGFPDAESVVVADNKGVHWYDLTGEKPELNATATVTGDQAAIDALTDGDIPKVRTLDDIDAADFPDSDKALVITPTIGKLELYDENEDPIATAYLRASEPFKEPPKTPPASNGMDFMASAMRELPPVERKVLSMRLRGEPDATIARVTKLSEKGVDNAYALAMGKMTRARAQAERLGSVFERALAETQPRTIGRPDLANPAKGEKSRRFVDAVDEDRGDTTPREQAGVREEAERRLDVGYAKERKRLLEAAQGGGSFSDLDTAMAKMIVAREALRAVKAGTLDRVYEAAQFVNAYRLSGTEQARGMAMRRDWTKNPAERAREFVAQALLTPPQKIRAGMEGAAPEKTNAALKDWARQMKRLKQRLKDIGLDLDSMTDEQIAKYLEDRVQAHNAVRTIADAKTDTWDALYEYWVSSILSGPATNVANVAGNAANALWDFTAQRFTEAAVNLVAQDPAAPTFGEMRHLWSGFMPGMADGFRRALRSWRMELPVFEAEVLGEASDEKFHTNRAIPGQAGRIIRMPLRLLLAADEMSKSVTARMQVGAEAYRMAKARGLSGSAMADFMREQMVVDPNNPTEAWRAAASVARTLAFQEELGGLGNSVIALRDSLPGLRYFMPFIKTIANIFKVGIRKSPLGSLNMLYRVGKGAVDMKWNGGEWTYSRKDAVTHAAEQMLAWGMYFALAGLAAPDGDDDLPTITGTVPYQGTKKGERDLAYRTAPPTSIRIGGEWYSYGRIEPFATALSVMVDGLNTARKAENGADFTKSLGRFFQHMTAQLKDKTFARGISDVLNAIEDGASLAQWSANFATSWVPNIIRASAKETDDAVREQKIWGRGEEWGARLVDRMEYNAMPVSGNAPPPKVDLWGREISKDIGVSPATDFLFRLFSPARMQPANKVLAVDRLIVNWNNAHPDEVFAPQPPEPKWEKSGKVDGARVEKTVFMTDPEYNRFLQIGGRMALARVSALDLNHDHPTRKDLEAIDKALADAHREARDKVWDERMVKK